MKKKGFLISFIVFCVLISAGYGIGNYFVNYALAPYREVREAEDIDLDQLDGLEKTVAENRQKEKIKGDNFYKKTKPMNTSGADPDMGLLRSRYYQDKNIHQWTILIHGYHSNSTEMMAYGDAYVQKGYNVLLPDNRAHGKSDGNYIGMGWLDKGDIGAWVDWIVERDPQAQIILHGVSMGGATVMMTAGDNLEHVIGYIEDCGYTSVWDIFANELKNQFSLPTFPILDISNIVARLKAGYDFKEASSVEQVKKAQQPMLFIHGGKDDFVPTQMVYEVYAAAKCEKELFIVAEAGHAQAKNVDIDAYWNKVFTFIENKIN